MAKRLLEKDQDNRRIDKLRTILLYEAGFNMINKYIEKTTMNYSEEHGLIANIQYGKRK